MQGPPAKHAADRRSAGILQRLGDAFARKSATLLPDPLVLAVLITFLLFLAAFFLASSPALRDAPALNRVAELVRIWFGGVWSPGFLGFALQMCLILLTGFGIAKSPPVAAAISRLAGCVRTPRQAVVLVAFVSCAGCWLNWGFGLIAGGFMAAELGRRFRPPVRDRVLPLLVAAAYAGMMIWHGGLSGSAPLKVADMNEGVRISIGAAPRTEVIDVSRTILSTENLALSLLLIVGIPIFLSRLTPSADQSAIMNRTAAESPEEPTPKAADVGGGHGTLASRLNQTRVLSLAFGAVGIGAISLQIASLGISAIDLNFVNLLFLSFGLLLHRNLIGYLDAVTAGGRAIVGIVIQFPLYAGIQAIMFQSGLSASISHEFVHAAVVVGDSLGLELATTFPMAAFYGAGLVNFFVPSGGGQWIVQGQIMCDAAESLGLPLETAVMAVTYGDQWTNMIQPFWAIPLMGLTGVNARRFMGYCALLMLVAMPAFLITLITF